MNCTKISVWTHCAGGGFVENCAFACCDFSLGSRQSVRDPRWNTDEMFNEAVQGQRVTLPNHRWRSVTDDHFFKSKSSLKIGDRWSKSRSSQILASDSLVASLGLGRRTEANLCLGLGRRATESWPSVQRVPMITRVSEETEDLRGLTRGCKG